MKIQIGDIFLNKEGKNSPYPNKSHKYLFPALGSLGAEFVEYFNSVYKFAVGIGDILYPTKEECRYEQNLFVLLKTSIAPNHFAVFIEWVRDQDYYRDDYVFDNLQKSDMHMLVLNMPNVVQSQFTNFLDGKYSQIFPTEYADKFFKNFPDSYKVIIRDHEYRVKFVNEINDEYNTDFTPRDWPGDADKKPVYTEEVFNDHFINSNTNEQKEEIDSRDTVSQ